MMRYIPFIIISLILYTVFFYHNQQPKLLSTSTDINAQIVTAKVTPLDFQKIADADNRQPQKQPINTDAEEKSEPTLAINNILEKEFIPQEPEGVIKDEQLTEQQSTENNNNTTTKEINIDEIVVDEINTAETNQTDIHPTGVNSANINNIAEELLPTSAKKQQNLAQFKAAIKSTAASDTALIKAEHYERDFQLDLPAPPAQKKKSHTQSSLTQSSLTQASVTMANKNAATKATEQEPSTTEKPKRIFKKQLKSPTNTTIPGLPIAIVVSGNKPPYPSKAEVQQLQGTVTAKFIVNMQGKTREPEIISSSGHKVLDDALLAFINKERFMPTLEGIEKVTSEQQFSFSYQSK